MAKLYPPNIEGTLPAFSGSALTVPFSMNRAVSANEVRGFAIKIKRVNDNSLVCSSKTENFDVDLNFEAYFDLSDVSFNVGEFYKVQIAYIENSGSVSFEAETIGYYSTVGVVKYTTTPRVFIEGMSSSHINTHNYQYTGVYSQTALTATGETFLDTTEKMYSSEFRLLDANNNIVKTSGEILHDTSKDTERYQSTEEFLISSDLELDVSYYLMYIVTTVNGLTANSPRYRIMQRRLIPMSLQVDFKASLDFENGAVYLNLISKEFQIASGSFLISRASSKNDFVWEEFRYFNLQSEQPDKRTFIDYTVEQGVTYRYSLQQYNSNGVYSDRRLSNDVYVDFEDLFLYDGERQLRVRYNPKVTNFKNDVVESKTDTIGSQYPFILRNGKVKYKEFSISGLISYKMDEVETFTTLNNLGINKDIYQRDDLRNKIDDINRVTTSLVDYNIAAERFFKLDVLDWLTNGEPKVFRSPTEGNYIVRLMNSTLAPNDTVGRMLHTFTCQAYEIADFTYENLNFYNFIHLIENQKTIMRWATIDLRSKSQGESAKWVKINSSPAYHISFTEMMPGATFALKRTGASDYEVFTIGATGAYKVDLATPVFGVYILENGNYQGQLTFGYKTKASNIFDNIINLNSGDVPCRQFIGHPYMQEADSSELLTQNILSYLSDVRTVVLTYYYIRFIKRELFTIYVDSAETGTGEDFNFANIKTYYKDGDKKEVISFEELRSTNPYSAFEIRYCRTEKTYINLAGETYYVDANNNRFRPSTGWVIDFSHDKFIKLDDNFYKVIINDTEMLLDETEHFELNNHFDPSFVSFGDGIICEIGYQTQTTIYSFEYSDPKVVAAKDKYEQELNAYLEKRKVYAADNTDVNLAYQQFIAVLQEAIDTYEEENTTS